MCAWACLGLGDCMRTCPFDAMYIVNGMVEIIPSKCVSCGQCVKACPRGITQLIPRRARMMIHCSTREKMKSVSDVCEVGCINCLKCLKACPADAIRYEKGRIEIDHEPCLEYGPACGEVCVSSCPRGIMRHHNPVPRAEVPIVDLSEPDAPMDCDLYPKREGSEPCEGIGPEGSVVTDKPTPEIVPGVSPSGKAPAPTAAESKNDPAQEAGKQDKESEQ